MKNGIMALGLLAMVGGGCDDGIEPEPAGGGGGDPVTEATAAAEAWLALVDEGRYGDSWDSACELFRGAVSKQQWEAQVRGARGPLGANESRAVSSAEYATELPGAPDGEYVVIQYNASFANKDVAVETITPMRDPDGVWRVSGYYIR